MEELSGLPPLFELSYTKWETVISYAEDEHSANWPSVVYSLCYHPDLLQQNSARASIERAPKEQQRQIFEQYVQSVLKRYVNRTFSLIQIFSSLVWLAQQMQQYYLTEFQLGALQVDWLSTRRAQIIHGLISGLVFGLTTAALPKSYQ